MSNSDQQSLEALDVITQRLESGVDHYSMLGLDAGAPVNDVRNAFFKFAKVLHPDLPVFAEPARKAKVTRAFQAISSAHNTLSDPNRRAEYDQMLGTAGAIKAGGIEPDPNLAKIYMHRSKQVLQQRQWAQAEDGLRAARELFGPDGDPECDTYLAWAIFNNTDHSEQARADESKGLLDGVMAQELGGYIEAQASYYLAIWCKLQGEVPSVRKHLERCLKLDPRHIDAQRELRLFDRRRKSSQTNAKKRRTTGEKRRTSRTDTPAASPGEPVKKVKLKKKKGFLDWLLGK